MAWTVEYLRSARKEIQKLDPPIRKRIREYLEERVVQLDDPRSLGKSLRGQLAELWRYRIGDYRVICEHRDKTLVVLVVDVGHRRDVYKRL